MRIKIMARSEEMFSQLRVSILKWSSIAVRGEDADVDKESSKKSFHVVPWFADDIKDIKDI